ncbi:(R)-mandelonitrile lyase [Tropicimonas marinistellae]|uniref:(R)-mandelonitrile lyase n=1 Tax=Tropicimonas marinistellae TaxID=1739787 RepID=UPI00082CFBA6|nr:cupin domain-containing protein [Tropicimonas marinistellae]
MKVLSASDQPSVAGSDATFSGQVRIDNLFSMPEPSTATAALVSFEPGARTAWHTHPRGQLLIVISGQGWVQAEGAPKRVIHAGDTIWFDPGEKHWHGATASHAMSHVAVQERENGSPVDWLQLVAEEDYLA